MDFKINFLAFFRLVLGTVVIFVIEYFDFIAGPKIDISILCIIPISFITWELGKLSGIILAILSASAWALTDLIHKNFEINYYYEIWSFLFHSFFFVIISLLLNKIKNQLNREKINARKDQLTGLGNLKGFFDTAMQSLKNCRENNCFLSLVYIDCDNFKYINDTFGHLVGDNVLITIAKILLENSGKSEYAARLGGDEFVVLYIDQKHDDVINNFTEIQKKLLQSMNNNNWPVTFSIGIASFQSPPESVKFIIEKADELMYKAKKNGKNNIEQGFYKNLK